MRAPEVKIVCSGGYVIHIEICRDITLECVKNVHKLYYMLKKELSGLARELVTGVTSVALFYDPRMTSGDELVRKIRELWVCSQQVELSEVYKPRTFTVPVAYGGELGPDLPSVASWAGLSEEEVIALHTSRSYTCYTLGFTPGFLYLGEVDPKIAAPRLDTPRVKIPAGSVGIAGRMTGVYGLESPGGWRLIGRTPLTMFDYRRNPPIPISPGDVIVFKPITLEEFSKLKGLYVGDYFG